MVIHTGTVHTHQQSSLPSKSRMFSDVIVRERMDEQVVKSAMEMKPKENVFDTKIFQEENRDGAPGEVMAVHKNLTSEIREEGGRMKCTSDQALHLNLIVS